MKRLVKRIYLEIKLKVTKALIPVEAVELLGLRKVKIGSHIGFPRDEE